MTRAASDRERLERTITTLKAMIEQADIPEHDKARCGSNDCPACEWMAFADQIDWPPWRRPEPAPPGEEDECLRMFRSALDRTSMTATHWLDAEQAFRLALARDRERVFSAGYAEGHEHQMKMRILDAQQAREGRGGRK